MAQFSNPGQVMVLGGTFNSANGDFHMTTNGMLEHGLHVLSSAVSHGAIHDSAERYPPPKCHPDTRKAVRQIILDWINDNSALPSFWLYGPAGAGKTAILQAIAEFLVSTLSPSEYFGASFFFSRGKHGRDQGHFLFPTIAYQLALKVPGLREIVNRIMEANPTLHTKSMTIQLQTLIVDAFQQLSIPPRRSYLLIIDGLDECQDKAVQQDILRLLGETITVHKLPLRFLIGSRPESHIRATFDLEALYTITQRVVLDETFNPGRDIQVFLRDSFAEICVKHSLKQPWPEKGIIDVLVQRSSGQFIYAATVLKFVGADFCNPTKQLALVLLPSPTAFSDLDQLYTQILSAIRPPTNIVRVLGIIVAFGSGTLTPEVIEDILEMEGDVEPLLRGLSSLIASEGDKNEGYLHRVPGVNLGTISFMHASFGDYLVDSSRSGPFYVNQLAYAKWVTARCFVLITDSVRRSWRIPTTATRLPKSKTWDYFRSHLPMRFEKSSQSVKDLIMADINNLAQEFWKFSGGGVVDENFTAMHCLMEILEALTSQSQRHHRPRTVLDERLRTFHEYQNIFDQSLNSAFSKSRDMTALLKLPGILVQKGLSVRGMADLYEVEVDLLERLSKSTIEPLYKLPSSSRYTLDYCLTAFLRDRSRSHDHYCDPTMHHVFVCRRFLSLVVGSKFSSPQTHDLAGYFSDNLYQHLHVATAIFYSGDNIPDGHLAFEILDDLDRITYDHLDESSSFKFPSTRFQPVWKWARDLDLKITLLMIRDVSLIERLRHLIDRLVACGSHGW